MRNGDDLIAFTIITRNTYDTQKVPMYMQEPDREFLLRCLGFIWGTSAGDDVFVEVGVPAKGSNVFMLLRK